MKKIALASLAIFAALASQHVAAQSKFVGPSFSVGLGMVGANTNLSAAASGVDSNDNPQSMGGGIDFGKTNSVAVLDLGYGFRINQNFVLGVGAAMDIGNTKSGSISVSSSQSPSTNGDLISLVGKKHQSFYVQPTWQLTPDTGLFVKVGYHKMSRSQDGLAGALLASQGISTSMNLSGTGYGVGVKTYINSNLFIQAEATTVSYKSQNISLPSELSENSSLSAAGLSAKVKTTAGIVSIGMNF